jgi:hypothetical protein
MRKPFIVVIEELNELLEHSENEHYDTSTTSKFLWGFVDSQNNNPDFFMIGTMNRDTKLPQPFKSRITARRVVFTIPTDPAIRRESLLFNLTNGGVKLENSINETYLNDSIQQCKDCDFRYLEEVALMARLINRQNNLDSHDIVLNKTDVEQAFKECADARIAMHYYDKEETETERQERHFVQRIVVENLVRQCQETHYQNVPHASGYYVKKTWQTMSPECIAALGGLLSESQQRLAHAFSTKSEEAKENKKRELEEQEAAEKKKWHQRPWYRKIL